MLLYTAISCTVFRGKINLTAEHYKKQRGNIIMDYPLSPFMFPTR